jgi:hypothetical protein
MGKRFSDGIEERLAEMAEIYLDHALQNPRLFELMFLKRREGARRYPRDFKPGRSPTANAMAEVVKGGMASGYFRDEDVGDRVRDGRLAPRLHHALPRGGRMEASPAQFRSIYRRSFRRYVRGVRK